MKLKSVEFFGTLLISISMTGIVYAGAIVGTRKCEPYSSRDTRPQPPKANITEAAIDIRSTGYVLKLTTNDSRGVGEFPLNSKLHLDWKLRAYTMKPLTISPDGKFSITILGSTNVCTFSGVARISPEAYTKLFRTPN